jgi:general secretion pathway protein L
MSSLIVLPPAPHALAGAAWGDVPPAGRDETVLVVPAAALSWHRVRLPAGVVGHAGHVRNSTRLRAVLEGLLEDQLLDEPSQMHLALQTHGGENGTHWVAACSRSWLKETLEALTSAGHTVRRIVPEWAPSIPSGAGTTIDDALPHDVPTELWVTGDENDAEMVWTDPEGVHRRRLHGHEEAAVDLTSALFLPEAWARHALVLAEPGCAALAERVLRREVTVRPRAQRLLACTEVDWELAQGEFANRHARLRRITQALSGAWQGTEWRAARWALGLLCLVQLTGLQAQAWQAREAIAAQRRAITAVLLDTFPSTPAVVDAPLQMQRAVDALGPSLGLPQSGDFERLLEAMGAAEVDENAPTAMAYEAGELRVNPVSSATPPSQALLARGYKFRVDGAQWVVSP